MSEIKFEVGDNVQLKSGGPVMVISKIYPQGANEADIAACIWYVGPKYDKVELDVRLLAKA